MTRRARVVGSLAAAGLALFACRTLHFGEPVPLGRLPEGLRPLHYRLELEIVPSRDGFRGVTEIDLELDRPLSGLWLHGRDLDVEAVELAAAGRRVAGRWEQRDPVGVARVELEESVGPGRATLRVEYAADFDLRLRGLYRVQVGADAYAFTQFEPSAARQAFPGFDAPAFKTPFDVTLRVRESDVAIANTPPVSQESLPDGLRSVRYATTLPIPTYLVAFAVGPLDVVEGPPAGGVPLRGVAARGRGPELAYALEHTPALLAALEEYVGDRYPYAKLDVLALPDFASGAMENVGAITFRESLLLLDEEQAPEWQRRGFASVMAHELAHQWFGNLVTMPWWDDLWLNEAFATWMAPRAVAAVMPEHGADLTLLDSIHGAMRADSRVSARSIRQPIASQHDVANAFDSITYRKGAGVLAMFERWLGPERFRAGVRRHLGAHRFGVADAGDWLAALSEAAGRDVAGPFRSFLDQPGLPLVRVETQCRDGGADVMLRQSRYLPLGSPGDRAALWQVPVCLRFAVSGEAEERCHLLAEREASLRLPGCPDWLLPNAAGAGYYRWWLPWEDARRLPEEAWRSLSARERLSFASNLGAAVRAGVLELPRAFGAFEALAADAERRVALAPLSLLQFASDHLLAESERPGFLAFARRLYGDTFARLGWEARPGEGGEAALRRSALLGFLLFEARDPELRAEAGARARAYLGLGSDGEAAALEPELVAAALSVLVQDGDPSVFDALEGGLHVTEDAIERSHMLRALGSTREPALAERARALSLDARLRVNETTATLRVQMGESETRADTWAWIREHFDALVERLGPRGAGRLPGLASSFCEVERAREVERFFERRIDAIEGGPRNLAQTLEGIRLCAALAESQRAATRAFFSPAPASAR